jgi:phosphoribosyl 1,2-cyclic phosphodiesterase
MIIKTIASSSKGTCYIISMGDYLFMIECGISLKRLRYNMEFDLSGIFCCMVSHEHADHAKYLKEVFNKTTIPVMCSGPTAEKYDVDYYIKLGHRLQLASPVGFKITSLELEHDCECYAFLIEHGKEKLFYASDTGRINYQVKGLTHLMIEANHTFEALIQSSKNPELAARIAKTHLSIEDVVSFVKRHKTLQEIHLLHLSSAHSDEEEFKNMVMDATGVPVFIAEE